jgi:hypothetical protein
MRPDDRALGAVTAGMVAVSMTWPSAAGAPSYHHGGMTPARLSACLLLALAGAACMTPVAPRGPFRGVGRATAQAGYHYSYGPISGQVAEVASPTMVTSVRGHTPGTLVGGEEANFVIVMPSVGTLRYQPIEACDAGADVGWGVAGLDVRCALPGTAQWLGLSLGGRSAIGAQLWGSYELRAAVDLIKPSPRRWVPIVNLGGSLGRWLSLAMQTSDVDPERDLFGIDAYFARSEARLEQAIGLEYHGPSTFFAGALIAHQVVSHGDFTLKWCDRCEPSRALDAEHRWAVGLTLTAGWVGR